MRNNFLNRMWKTACLPFLTFHSVKSLPYFLLTYFSFSQKTACLPFLTFNSVKSLTVCLFLHFIQSKAVLRIHDILGWIRIRILGSMPLTNGSWRPKNIWIRWIPIRILNTGQKSWLSAFSYFSFSQKSACLPFLTFHSVKNSACLPFLTFISVNSLPVCLFLLFVQSKVCPSTFSYFNSVKKVYDPI